MSKPAGFRPLFKPVHKIAGYYKKPTREQQLALLKVWMRDKEWNRKNRVETYLKFRRTAYKAFADECIMVPWCGMILGIERDGHTHS